MGVSPVVIEQLVVHVQRVADCTSGLVDHVLVGEWSVHVQPAVGVTVGKIVLVQPAVGMLVSRQACSKHGEGLIVSDGHGDVQAGSGHVGKQADTGQVVGQADSGQVVTVVGTETGQCHCLQ
jgi:hypothetical protein